MEKPFTKEQLLDSIRVIDKGLNQTEQLFAETEELAKNGVPDEFREEWEECVKYRRALKNIRILLVNDLRVNHGITIE